MPFMHFEQQVARGSTEKTVYRSANQIDPMKRCYSTPDITVFLVFLFRARGKQNLQVEQAGRLLLRSFWR